MPIGPDALTVCGRKEGKSKMVNWKESSIRTHHIKYLIV